MQSGSSFFREIVWPPSPEPAWYKSYVPTEEDAIWTRDYGEQPIVKAACASPRSPTSVFNAIFNVDSTTDEGKALMGSVDHVRKLIVVWFTSGSTLDKYYSAFAPVIRELKSGTLTEPEWNTLEGTVAKIFLADQLSRSAFRGTDEAFSYDPIARELMSGLTEPDKIGETIKLPPGICYLLVWALVHSEKPEDSDRGIEWIELCMKTYPDFYLFNRNRIVTWEHQDVLKHFGRCEGAAGSPLRVPHTFGHLDRTADGSVDACSDACAADPQRNGEFKREMTPAEQAWLDDKETLPMWAGGKKIIVVGDGVDELAMKKFSLPKA